MKSRILASASAVLALCLSCVEIDNRLGGNFVPVDQQFDVFCANIPIKDIQLKLTDSLSGYSSTRITVGAIRDAEFGLTTRASAFTVVPLADTLDFGRNPKVNWFNFGADFDTVSVASDNQKHILQGVQVKALTKPLSKGSGIFDCNDVEGKVAFSSENIMKGTPILNGQDNLVFDLTDGFSQNLVDRLNGFNRTDHSFSDYLDIFPGIYICTDTPAGIGGRINIFDLQLGYNATNYTLNSNLASLNISSCYGSDTTPRDTTFYFYFGAQKFENLDSLASAAGSGTLPVYALNLTGHETRSRAGAASETLYVEGGGGLKPVFTAATLRELAVSCITDTLLAYGRSAADVSDVLLNKASIILPYDFEEDVTDLSRFPDVLSPTCRIKTDTTATFMGLTDASNSDENQGDIDLSRCRYCPDITYHMQQLLLKDGEDPNILNGNYDIWMLTMSYETTTTTNTSNNDMSEYYKYLAYQSYYNNMYGGYGGYGGYGYGGYGGYGGSYYNNYYSYMMMAMYASSNNTTTSTDKTLDKDRWYLARLNGPDSADGGVPTLKLIFSIPRE